MKDIKSSNRHNPEVLDRSMLDTRPTVKTKSSLSPQDSGERQPTVRMKPARSIQERNTSVTDRSQTEQLEHAGAQEPERMPPEAQQTTMKREMDAQPGTDAGQPIIPVEQANPNASNRCEDDKGEQLKGYPEHAGVQEPARMSPRVSRTVQPTESAAQPQADVKHLAARERQANVPEQLRRSIRTRDSAVSPDSVEEQPVIRTKPSKDNREHSTTIQNRSQSQPVDGHMRGASQGTGSAPFTAAAVGIVRAASAAQGAVNATVSAQPEKTSPSEPTRITPQTRRTIHQVSVTLAAQSARIARQAAVSAAQAVAGKSASSQPSSRRNNPNIKGTPALKIMKRGVVQAGRSIKNAANKTADQLSRDPSTSRDNPDKAASDLAIRQAQAIAAKAAQVASRRAAQAAGRVAAKVSAQAARLAVKAVVYLAQVAAKAVSALLAAAGPVGVVIIVVVLAAIIALLLLSPMGIFAGGGGDGTPTISEMVAQLNGELTAKIDRLKNDEGADQVTVDFDGTDVYSALTNWPDILGVFAVTVGLDEENPTDVIVMNAAKQDALRSVFWSMVHVSSSTKLVDAPSSATQESRVAIAQSLVYRPSFSVGPEKMWYSETDEGDATASPTPSPTPIPTPTRAPTPTPAPKIKVQSIQVDCMDWEEARDLYDMSDDQVSVLQSLISAKNYTMLAQLVGAATGEAATDWSGIIDVPEGGMPIPLYLQGQYTQTVCYIKGVAKSVKSSGCGAASSSMVIAYLTGNTTQTPYTLFRWAYDHGYYNGNGLSHSCLSRFMELYGLKGTWIENNAERITEALRAGRPVIAHMGPGIFTDQGHYIVLRGITEDGLHVLVNDPGSRKRNKYAYLLSSVVSQARTTNSFMICSK